MSDESSTSLTIFMSRHYMSWIRIHIVQYVFRVGFFKREYQK